mmetsp:Transcript_81401/g.231054  ORF Transcript_81401/g.231054 Transcript_81401/m.231054 type:complete len:343 (+) Transcript_81401:492-1520(+)
MLDGGGGTTPSGWGAWWRRNSADGETTLRPIPMKGSATGVELEDVSSTPPPPVGSLAGNPGSKAAFSRSNSEGHAAEQRYRYRKSLFPTAEQLDSLGLKPGVNTIEFIVQSARQGERSVSARIFLWTRHAKIVVTDIDGTITRSNLRGHLIPMLGRDWSHSGVAKLFSDVVQNGYQIVYLTTRPIGQASMTKDYLESLSQEDATLPQGPVLLSPESLFHNTTRRERLSHVFKISALRGIRLLFPDNQNPYHAGFGNEAGDMVAYRKAGVPRARVFCVNFEGELQSLNNTFRKSYANINALLDEIFPPVSDVNKARATSDQFVDVNFWRTPPPVLDSDEEDLP